MKNNPGRSYPSQLAVSLLYCLMGIAISSTTMAEELLVEFIGDDNKLTNEFEVEGPWLLDWHVSSDFPKQSGIEVNLVESSFLSHMGLVLVARDAGGGTKLFNESGKFRFRIASTATRWRLRVSKISEEEADQMIRVKK